MGFGSMGSKQARLTKILLPVDGTELSLHETDESPVPVPLVEPPQDA